MMKMKSVTSHSSQPRMLKMGGFKVGSMQGQPTMQRIKVGGDASKMGMMRMGGMTRTVTSSSSSMKGMMRMGGMGGMIPGMTRRAPPVFKMTGTKARLVDAE
jgi:hypothetical protein